MRSMRNESSRTHPNREEIEELCSLYVLGEISRDDKAFLEGHLSECEECRELVQGFERIALFDLPALASLRTDNFLPESLEFSNEDEIRAKVLERARNGIGGNGFHNLIPMDIVCQHSMKSYKFSKSSARAVLFAAGWAIAAVLVMGIILRTRTTAPNESSLPPKLALQSQQQGEISELKQRELLAERQRDEAIAKRDQAASLSQSSAQSLAQMTLEYDSLDATYSSLKAEMARQQDQLKQETAQLELTRRDLKEQMAARDQLQGQLSEASDRLQRNGAEVARLQRIAATTATRLPVSGNEIDGNEAKEILGARDLHIVDVYDVDNAGNSSREYGRVYYVNRNSLVFYAFDLSRLERNHKAVAFQAWGFRQPQSTKAESLGLFYMDNASLNRWTLRISDPQLLSRIDTLFVTVEPPGGSRSPKGRRLLMASLAGPANHP